MGLALAFAPILLLAQAPQWWANRGVTNGNAANDYAATNQGQVKNIAVAAVAELDANLPGGAGDALHSLAVNLSGTTANTNDYAAVNLGQVKNISKPFFDRLLTFGYAGHPLESGTYPWVGRESTSNDYAMANIGQVKNLFSFDLTVTGTNGLPDWWQNYYFGSTVTDPNALAPSGVLVDGSAATILQAYQNGLNPVDYYNSSAPTLAITNGNTQTGSPGNFVSKPLVVKVTDSAGNAIAKAPLVFSVAQGGGTLQATTGGTNAATLNIRTNTSGYAIVYFQLPNTANTQCQVTCTPATGSYASASVTFTETSDNGSGTYSTPVLPADDQPENPPTPPVVSYAAIDLSSGDIGSGGVEAISLGDDNNGAYAFRDSNGKGPIAKRWINGVVDASFSNDTGFPKYIDYISPSTSGTTTFYVELDDSQGLGFRVTADGTIYGNASGPFGGTGFRCQNSSISWICDDLLSYYQQQDPTVFLVYNSRLDGSGNSGCFGYVQRLSLMDGWMEMSTDSNYIFANNTVYDFPWEPDAAPAFIPFAMNDSGAAIGYKTDTEGQISWQIWNGNALTSMSAGKRLIAINNSNQVLGCEASGGCFLWQGIAETTEIETLIPSEYKSQISAISPRLLSNADPNGLIHILFDATFTDPNDGSTSQKTYVLSGPYASLGATNRTALQRAFAATSLSDFTIQEVKLPDGISSSNIKCANANGIFAVIANNCAFLLLPVQLTPDYDRDGKIDDKDVGKVTEDNPWRWWVDDDHSDRVSTIVATPGQPNGQADYGGTLGPETYGVLDWFPVYLDIKQLLEVLPPGDSVQYVLHQNDEALNFLYTSMTPGNTSDFLLTDATGYGDNLGKALKDAEKHQITRSGYTLSNTFLNKIKDEGKGVLLLQGRVATERPLLLVVYKDGQEVAKVRLSLKIDGVEKMYRWINLRGVTGGSVGRASDTSEPSNYPDKLTNDKHFVFVHGYNVDENAARGWHAQMFKRLYQTGSKAKFTAVAWRGNQSQVGDLTVDYWENVKNAFLTSSQLASTVNGLPGTKVIAAHSLGNMVVSSAIKDHSLSVSNYFLLDAAVALEAFDSSMSNKDSMKNPDWHTSQGDYPQRLWASEWYSLFDGSDGRSKLAWRDRFGAISGAYNFYSSGEEVLANGNGQKPPFGTPNGAWVRQEMVKGTNDIQALITLGSQGGWGFNSQWGTWYTSPDPNVPPVYIPPTFSEASAIGNDELKTKPFFKLFSDSRLINASQGSAAANEYPTRAKTLAEAIPALTFAAGANSITNFTDSNMDMLILEDGWPRSDTRWLHGDAKDVAYRYNHPLYEKWVSLGGLK